MLGVSQGSGESPNAEFGKPSAQSRETEFGLDATFSSDEFVPLIDDDSSEAGEVFAEVIVCEKKREALWRGDEAEREFFAKLRFLIGRSVASTHADFDFEIEIFQGFLERFLSIERKGSERCDPEDSTAFGVLCFDRFCHGAEPDREGLAEPGGRMQEAGLTIAICLPSFFLKWERPPASIFEKWGDRGSCWH